MLEFGLKTNITKSAQKLLLADAWSLREFRKKLAKLSLTEQQKRVPEFQIFKLDYLKQRNRYLRLEQQRSSIVSQRIKGERASNRASTMYEKTIEIDNTSAIINNDSNNNDDNEDGNEHHDDDDDEAPTETSCETNAEDGREEGESDESNEMND